MTARDRREMLSRTAKSCGPDAPALASSWRSFVGPTGCRQNLNPQATVTTSRSPGRARRKPLKPLRAGAPGESGCTCGEYSCAFHLCARGCGCSWHPAFPTPSFRGEGFLQTSGVSRRGIAKLYLGVIARSESDEAIHFLMPRYGLLRGACHRARIRATRWLATTISSWLFEIFPSCH